MGIPLAAVVCQLESSGRWADDLCAIGKMKTAFYLYIAKAASDQRGLLCSPTEQFLDIFKVSFHYDDVGSSEAHFTPASSSSPVYSQDLCSGFGFTAIKSSPSSPKPLPRQHLVGSWPR